MGDTNPFHPQCVKFQPLPVLFNPPWLGMQQSALSAEQLHLKNLGLQAAAAYLALTSESMELHQDLWKEDIIAASTQADCVGAAAAGTMHSSHQHHAVMALVGTGVPVVLAGFSSGSLLQSASLHWDNGLEMSVGW